MTQEEENQPSSGADTAKEERIKMMARVVCICKGITLGRVMKGIEGCDTVADVNRKVGTGSGGCAGERCGPRLVTILRKLREAKEAKKDSSDDMPETGMYPIQNAAGDITGWLDEDFEYVTGADIKTDDEESLEELMSSAPEGIQLLS